MRKALVALLLAPLAIIPAAAQQPDVPAPEATTPAAPAPSATQAMGVNTSPVQGPVNESPIQSPRTVAAASDPNAVRVNQQIVYGNDPCPRGRPDEITVCARLPENERYRIPSNLRDNPNAPANQSWTNRAVQLRYVGRTGIQSCSTDRPRRLYRLPAAAHQPGARRAPHRRRDQLEADDRGGPPAAARHVDEEANQAEAEQRAEEQGDPALTCGITKPPFVPNEVEGHSRGLCASAPRLRSGRTEVIDG